MKWKKKQTPCMFHANFSRHPLSQSQVMCAGISGIATYGLTLTYLS